MAKKGEQDTAYTRENDLVLSYKAMLAREDLTVDESKAAMADFLKHYENLLGDTKLLTSVGDRLQRKLKSSNLMLNQQAEEIQRINESLQKTNDELKQTIDDLTKAKASRKAQTYLLIIAVALFMVTELIENAFESIFDNVFIAMAFKLFLVFPFKFIESYLEDYFLKQAIAASKKEAAARVAQPAPSTL